VVVTTVVQSAVLLNYCQFVKRKWLGKFRHSVSDPNAFEDSIKRTAVPVVSFSRSRLKFVVLAALSLGAGVRLPESSPRSAGERRGAPRQPHHVGVPGPSATPCASTCTASPVRW
jgi:hypothetical protein